MHKFYSRKKLIDSGCLYTRYPIVARRARPAFRPSASREQRYLAYKADAGYFVRVVCIPGKFSKVILIDIVYLSVKDLGRLVTDSREPGNQIVGSRTVRHRTVGYLKVRHTSRIKGYAMAACRMAQLDHFAINYK